MSGFDGLSSTNAGALPELILAAYRALERGDAATCRTLHRLWYPYRELARRFGQPQTVKTAMNLRGWGGGHVRRPLFDLTSSQHDALATALHALAADPASGVIVPG